MYQRWAAFLIYSRLPCKSCIPWGHYARSLFQHSSQIFSWQDFFDFFWFFYLLSQKYVGFLYIIPTSPDDAVQSEAGCLPLMENWFLNIFDLRSGKNPAKITVPKSEKFPATLIKLYLDCNRRWIHQISQSGNCITIFKFFNLDSMSWKIINIAYRYLWHFLSGWGRWFWMWSEHCVK